MDADPSRQRSPEKESSDRINGLLRGGPLLLAGLVSDYKFGFSWWHAVPIVGSVLIFWATGIISHTWNSIRGSS